MNWLTFTPQSHTNEFISIKTMFFCCHVSIMNYFVVFTVPVYKFGHTFSFMVFLCLYYFLHCRSILNTSKVGNFCFDDSFAQFFWHSLGEIHEVVTWNDFQLTVVPCQELIFGISCILNPLSGTY